MSDPRLRTRATAAVVAVAFALLFVSAALAELDAPVAISNVTIHDSDGAVTPNATILIEDGRIAAVGTSVQVPATALTIDAAGLHAYPAFIDAASRLSVKQPQRTEAHRHRVEDENPDPAQGPLAETRLANRRGIRPETRVIELYDPGDNGVEDYLRAGFGSLLAVPSSGIFAGYAALIDITDVPLRRAVVRDDVAQLASFETGEPGDYPSTLLGVIAVFRQFAYDAQWYRQLTRYAERHPRSPERLPTDEALQAMVPVVTGRAPVVFEANTEVEILRALALAREFNFRIWICGGREAYKLADALADARVPVIARLDFDDEPRFGPPQHEKGSTTSQPADTDSEPKRVYDPIKVQRDKHLKWEQQVENLRTLDNAGVTVAVSSLGLDHPDKLIEKLRLAMKHGLAANRALAALTVNPARMFNVDNDLGAIREGSLANIVLTTAPFDDENARVRWMFVEGKRFEYKAKPADDDKAKDKKTDEATEEVQFAGGADWAAEVEADRKPRTHTGGNVFLDNATVITVAGDDIGNGDVFIRDGKIAAVGRNLTPPDGVARIDCSGLFVMPGIIDCHTHIAIDDANEWPLAISSEARVGDVIDHRQLAIYRALAGGVTTIHTMHGSANPIGGENVILKLRYGRRPDDLRFAGAPRSLKFALGENVTQSHGSAGSRFPNTRMGVESVMRQALTAANEYRGEQQRRAAQVAAGHDEPPLRRDLRMETLAGVLTGDVYVHCHGYRASEFLRVMKMAEDFGFRIAALHHVLEGYRIAPEIVRHGCGASCFASMWAYKIEAFGGIPYNAAAMTRQGVSVSVNSDSADLIRYLNVEAAKTVRWGGLSDNEALRLVTLNPAEQLGIGDRVGSIEVGKDGDIAIFNGHPLDSFSKCVMTLIDGEVYFENPRPKRNAKSRPIARAPQHPLPIERGEHALYAITNATIHPISSPLIPNGRIVIRDDRIAAVGADVVVPPGAIIIDAHGGHVFPGLVDAGSRLGLSEILMEPATRDDREIAHIAPELRAVSAFNPFSEHLRVARCAGITTALVQPAGGWISGRSAIVDLDGWSTPPMLDGDDFAMHMSIPVLPADLPESDREAKSAEHDKNMKELEDFLDEARQYARITELCQPDGTSDDACPPRDLRLEAMIPYVRGNKPVVFHAQDVKSIIESIEFAEKHHLRCIINGGQEAWKCADVLAEHKVPVVFSAITSVPASDYEPFDSVFACPAALAAANVKFCFGSGSAAGAFELPIDVGIAVANGLSPARAMRALTLDAADILGVSQTLGSLEPGKIANVIVCSDLPIQAEAGITCLFIKGRPIELTNLHTEELARFKQRPTPQLPPAPDLVGPKRLSAR